MNRRATIAVIGAGFSGSLLALLLKQSGFEPVLVDRGSHPRFAIGESSTPIANLILADLAQRYDLPRLAPLASYGPWKRAYPDLVCGVKRGFSYFHHHGGRDFEPRADHANELLVAASAGPEDADTHWLRSDFDQFLMQEAVRAGVDYSDQTELTELVPWGSGWVVRGVRAGRAVSWRVDLVIDASGEGGFLARQIGIDSHPAGLKTRSRGLFSHFRGVRRWQNLYEARGGDSSVHPYPCDAAALHHVFDGGWMWVLPFDNGVTSAGFSLDPDRFPRDSAGPPETEWARLLDHLPAVREQFECAEPVVPWRQTGRIQRRLCRAAGANWILLPNTAVFLDPLHSTGNAWTLVGIDRLMDLLERTWGRPEWSQSVQGYEQRLQQEAEFLDGIVSGSFRGFAEFERMVALSMFYFSAATWSEAQRRAGQCPRGAAFLSADDPGLRAALDRAVVEIADPGWSVREFTERVRQAIAPYNRVGLCDPGRKNQYPFEG